MNKRIVFLSLCVSAAASAAAFAAEVPASVVGLWSSAGAAWDWLDDFDGPNAVLAVGATNAARPGPGRRRFSAQARSRSSITSRGCRAAPNACPLRLAR